MNKLNYDFIKRFILNLGYILQSKSYIGNNKPLIMSDKDGYFYKTTYANLKAKKSPLKFAQSNPYTIKNIKLWCKINDKPFKLISDEYVNNSIRLEWRCLKKECGDIFLLSWSCIHENKGCAVCHGKQVGESNSFANRNPHIIHEWHPTKNGNLTPYNTTYGSKKRIWWKCKHGHEWEVAPFNRSDGYSCPLCVQSSGELIVSNWLYLNNINFVYCKKFKDLKGVGGNYLSYDFYIEDHNLLIEYQGQYHDNKKNQQPEEKFKKQQEHDKRKRDYAKNNNIKLLEIWYWDFDKAEEILKKHIKKIRNDYVS